MILLVLGIGLYFTSVACYRATQLVDRVHLEGTSAFVVYLRFGVASLAQFAVALYIVGKLLRSDR